MDFSWVKVPCDIGIKNQRQLCQIQQSTLSFREKPIKLSVKESCPIGWLYIEKQCLQLQKLKVNSSLCLGGNVAQLNSMHLVNYLNVIKFKPSYGSVCVQEGGRCIFYESKRIAPHDDYPLGVHKRDVFRPNRFVVCRREITWFTAECHHYMFTCGDASCLLQPFVCDGVQNCPIGEDERDCKGNNNNA